MANKLDSSLIIPDKTWNANQWVDLYDNLKAYFGDPKKANTLWLAAWTKRGTSDANTADLRHTMKGHGIDIPAGSLGGSLLDTENNIGDKINGVLSIGGKIGMVYTAIMVIITIVVLIKVIKMINPESVGTIVKYSK